MAHDGSDSQNGVLVIVDSKYIDVRGDGLLSHSWKAGCKTSGCYGIVVYDDGTPSTPSRTVAIKDASDHIKISYMEIYQGGSAAGIAATGIGTVSTATDNTWTIDTVEIHHNYIHDTRYLGMYLGFNIPLSTNDPYLKDFSIHDNLFEDIGAYGLTLKGVKSGSTANYIYNNIIRPSDRTASEREGG